MVTTHPSDETLELYASGSLTEGMDMFVKGHLHFCPTCREKVEVLEMVAGELLSEDIISADLGSLSFQNVLNKVDEQESRELKETKESIHGGVMPNMMKNPTPSVTFALIRASNARAVLNPTITLFKINAQMGVFVRIVGVISCIIEPDSPSTVPLFVCSKQA